MHRHPQLRTAHVVVLLVVAALTTLVGLVALDRIAAHLDVGYAPSSGTPSASRRLTTPEFSVHVVTNELGFREARLPTPKPPGTVRIVAVGDSFTQGYGVEDDESYPRRLELLLRERDPQHQYEVVNLGVPGTNPLDYLGHLRALGMRYQPDLVIVGLMANDVQDVRTYLEQRVAFSGELLSAAQGDVAAPRPLWKRAANALLPTLYPLAWQALRAPAGAARPSSAAGTGTTGSFAPRSARLESDRWPAVMLAYGERLGVRQRAETVLRELSPEQIALLAPLLTGAIRPDDPEGFEPTMLLLGLLRPRLLADAVLLPPAYDAAWQRTASLLRDIDATARAGGARTLILFIPALHQVSAAGRTFLEKHHFQWDGRTLSDTTFSDRLDVLGRDAGIRVLDLLPMLRAAARRPGPRLYFPEDGHWTKDGHALAARAIADALSPGGQQRAIDRPLLPINAPP